MKLLVLESLAWCLARVPLRAAEWALGLLSWVWWTLLPIRRRVALENFRAALPDVSPGPPLRRMLSSLMLGYVELLHERRRPTVEVALEGYEALGKRVAAGEPSIILMGHFECWDLVGPILCRNTGLPATVIVNPPTDPFSERLIEDWRRSMGLELIDTSASFFSVFRHLKRGRSLIFFLDQRYNAGEPIPFFGRPAWTSTAAAGIAARVGLPVYTCRYWREGLARHRAVVEGPLTLSGDVMEDSRRFQGFYEDVIRARPWGWLWLHRRWRKP